MNIEFITKDDLKAYKKILMTNKAHLTRYLPDDNINTTRGKNFLGVTPPLFATPKEAVSNPYYILSGHFINDFYHSQFIL